MSVIRLLLIFLLPVCLHAEGKPTVSWLAMPVHGLAVVLETPSDKAFLIDTGGVSAKPDYNAGRDTIAPFLKARGYGEIEGVAISHPHGDHYGGVEWLIFLHLDRCGTIGAAQFRSLK